MGYFNNIEYFNRYREGMLYCGGFGNFRIGYRPTDDLRFSAGIHLRKAYGDDKFLTNTVLLLNFSYNPGRFYINIGELDSEERHNLIDALIKEQYQYDPAIEEGFQTGFNGDIIQTELWLSTHLLNTPGHREHLCIGNFNSIGRGFITLELMAYWDHYGGQLFSPPDDPVRDNLTGSGGLLLSHNVSDFIDKAGIEVYGLGSLTSENRKTDPYHRGYGYLTKLWFVVSGYKTSFQFYDGNGYQTWKGNHLYQADKYYYFLQIEKHLEFSKNSFIDFGVKFDFVDIPPKDYFKHTEHQIWIKMGSSWNKEIRTGKNR